MAQKNAGLLAIQILAIGDEKLDKKMVEYKKKLENQVLEKGGKLEKLGVKKYLAQK
jgi:phosphoribosylcarboxyaminoimidazole (NCAIR) mutase